MENFNNNATNSNQTRNTFNMENLEVSYENFLSELVVRELDPLELKILYYFGEDATGGYDHLVSLQKRSQFYKNICYFAALGGFLPKSVMDALQNNIHPVEDKMPLDEQVIYTWSAKYSYPWATEVLGLEDVSEELTALKEGNIVLIKPNKYGKFDKKTKKLIKLLSSKGVIFKTLTDLYCEKLTEAEITAADISTYLHNLGAKEISPNKWELKVVKRLALDLEYDPDLDNWILWEGTQKLYLRNFHAFNGEIPATQKHTAFITVINYLITGLGVDTFKGRKAFLSDVFEDITYVGYSHKLLNKFKANKLGNLAVEMTPNKCLPIVSKSRDLLTSAGSYEEAGHSVFLHKGAKYCVIDAECAFFSRQEGMTNVAWQSDKRSKLTGRNLFSVATAGKVDESNEDLIISLDENQVYSRDLNGELFNYSGINYYEAAVASPLVEEGSGQGLAHPETTRTFATKTKVKAVLPLYVKSEEDVLEQIKVAPLGTQLSYMQPVITQASAIAKTGYVALAFWDSLIPGEIVGEPEIKYNNKTNTVEVAVNCIHKQAGDAEKFRGFCKYRSNGGFLKNIAIYNGDELIFNPNVDLHDAEGKLQQVEHCIGGEEYKTLMFVISLLADKMPGGKAIWDSVTGDWENKEILEALIESECKRVTITRWGIEATCYQMLKANYGENPDFAFNDEEREVTHSNALCWTGTHANIVEVPLTGVFVGKTKMFAEHIAYLGTEYPALYQKLMTSVFDNQKLVKSALDIVKGNIQGATDENPYGDYLVVDDQTQTLVSEKVTVSRTKEDGIYYCSKIQMIEEYDWEFLTALSAKMTKNNIPGFVFEPVDMEGEPYSIVLPLDIILRLTGTISHKIIRNLIQILMHLETELDDRDTGNWTGKYYRYVRLLESSLEEAVVNSNKLIARATKTTDVAFTCRAGTTIDESVKLDELHIHPDLAALWKLREGDTAIIGRVPVPGAGSLKLVFNEAVPYGTAVCNAAIKHAIEEGDSDGDSMLFLVIDQEGMIVKPPKYLPNVNAFNS